MANKEALGYNEVRKMQGSAPCHSSEISLEATAMVGAALDKQIPNEVDIELVGCVYKWFCPVCKIGTISGNKVDKPKYCS